MYAWAVTAAPVAFGAGTSLALECTAALGLASLTAGPILERAWPDFARMLSGWGLVVTSIVIWIVAPESTVGAIDAPRGIAGMAGWGLFAFAVAAPPRASRGVFVRAPPFASERAPARAQAPIVLLGLFIAIAVEIPGWRLPERDRALLFRVVALAGSLGALATAGVLGAVRDRSGERESRRRSPVRLYAWLGLAITLVGAGIGYAVLQRPR